ncbi:MAG: PKD domain-containing protein [Patescibacteria group bacterium]
MRMLKIAGFFLVLGSLALAGRFASAAELINVTYTLQPSTASIPSDHTITFKTPSTISNGTLTLYLRNVVAATGMDALVVGDIDLSHGATLASQTDYTLAAAAGNNQWGVAINTTTKTIQFTYPTGGATQIAAQEYVMVKIGKNATGGNSNNQMVNSSNIATRTFSIVAQPTGGAAAHVGIGYARGGALSYATSSFPPKNVSATAGSSSQVSIAWDVVTGASGYNVYRSSSTDGTYTRIGSDPSVSSGTTTGYSDTALTASTTYFYRVTAIIASVETGQSSTSSATTQAAVTGGTPSVGGITGGSTGASSSGATSSGTGTASSTGTSGTGTSTSGTTSTATTGTQSTQTASTAPAPAAQQPAASPPPPPAELSATASGEVTNLSVKFSCTGSGGASPYSSHVWSFGDKSTGTGIVVTHIYAAPGSYTSTCTLKDSTGKSVSGSVTVQPVQELSVTATAKTTNLLASFTCSASGGTTSYVSYAWDFGDGATGTESSTTHNYKSAGSYSALCTVKDSVGKTASGSVPVQASELLSASATASGIELDASFICTAGGGNPPYAFVWDFGDGATGKDATVKHTYTKAGLYSALCTVADAKANKTTASAKVGIVEPLSFLDAGIKLSGDAGTPLVRAIADYPVEGKGLDIYGSCTSKGGVAPYSYLWNFGDTSSSTVNNPIHTYRDEGKLYTKEASCTISDARGKSITSPIFTITLKELLRVKAAVIPPKDRTTITTDLPASLSCAASGGVTPYTYSWKAVQLDETGRQIKELSGMASSASQEYLFSEAGTYSITCTVQDKDKRQSSNTATIGVAKVELAQELKQSVEEVKKEIDTAVNTAAAKAIDEIKAAAPPPAPPVKSGNQISETVTPVSGGTSGGSSAVAGSAQGPQPAAPAAYQAQSSLFVGTSSGSTPEIAPIVPAPPAGASEAAPNVSQNSVRLTISTSAPVTGSLCQQVAIKNAEHAPEMFVWFCPSADRQTQSQPLGLFDHIKLAARDAWYGLKRLALGTDQSKVSLTSTKKKSLSQVQAISLDIDQGLMGTLSSSLEKQLAAESKKLLAAKVKRATPQQLVKLSAAIKLVVQSGLQKIELYSFDGARLGDVTGATDFSSVLVVKKSLGGRIIEIIAPQQIAPGAVAETISKSDIFFASNLRERSNEQITTIQKEFNKLAQKAYAEGLIALRKRYAKEIALSSDVDDALQKTIIQRLKDPSVQKQLIDLARSTVVQQVVTGAAAEAVQDEEPVVPGQQPTLSQLLHTPDSITIAPLNQGQAEKLLKQELVVPGFPGAKPLPNQIKEVSVLDENSNGLIKLPSPMKLTMCWDDTILNAMNISIDPMNPSRSMCIAHFDPLTGTGTCEKAVFDMAAKCATTEVDSVSIFALFGKSGTAKQEESLDQKPQVDITVMPSVRLRLVESLIDSDDLGIHQQEEAVNPSELAGNIYIAPSTQLSLCISPNAFLKKVKGINVSIGSKTYPLAYEQSRLCFSGKLTVPSDQGAKKVQMRIVYIDDQVQIITLNTVVTNKLQAIILNQIALPVSEVSKIIAAVNEQVKETVEVAQSALQTTAVAAAPVVAVANPAVLTNTVNWYHYLNHLFSWLFSILGFRKRRKPWGVVYDAAAKEPIDLAVVRLFDKKTNKLVETQVTDKHGRFSFLTTPGTYSLSIAKPPYTFPSTIVTKTVDGEYANIYRQQDITISNPDQVMSMSIPLDPPSRERVKGLTPVQQVNQFLKQHSSGSLIVGLVISAALAFYTPGVVNGTLFVLNGIYVFFQLTIMGRTEKPWGIVFSAATLEPVPLAAISIIDAKENKVLRTRLTDYYGRFNFLTPPGMYSVLVSKDAYQFPIPESMNIPKYHHIYRGGTMRIKKEKGYIKINVPLIPKSSSSASPKKSPPSSTPQSAAA